MKYRGIRLALVLIIILSSASFVVAQDLNVAYDNSNLPRVVIDVPEVTATVSGGGNSSWNQSAADERYLRVDGGNVPTGNIDWNGFALESVGTLQVLGDSQFFGDILFFASTFNGANSNMIIKNISVVDHLSVGGLIYGNISQTHSYQSEWFYNMSDGNGSSTWHYNMTDGNGSAYDLWHYNMSDGGGSGSVSVNVTDRLVLSAYDSDGGQVDSIERWRPITFDTNYRIDDVYINHANGNISVIEGGDYLLHYDVCLGQSLATPLRTQFDSAWFKNGVLIEGSRGFGYSRGLGNANHSCATAEIVQTLSADDNVTVNFRNSPVVAGTVATLKGASRIFIEKLGIQPQSWQSKTRIEDNKTATTDYTDDDTLRFSVVGGKNYTFDFEMFINAPGAHAAVFNFTRPAGEIHYGYYFVNGGTIWAFCDDCAETGELPPAGVDSKVTLKGSFYPTASGEFVLQYRSANIALGDLDVLKGSHGTIREVTT